jgi:hypothetical protein
MNFHTLEVQRNLLLAQALVLKAMQKIEAIAEPAAGDELEEIYDDAMQLQLRIGIWIVTEENPYADQMLRHTVDTKVSCGYVDAVINRELDRIMVEEEKEAHTTQDAAAYA